MAIIMQVYVFSEVLEICKFVCLVARGHMGISFTCCTLVILM